MSSNLIKSRLILPTIWKQTVRYRGKMTHPRHDIARFLEETTKSVLTKEIPDPIYGCLNNNSRSADSLKFSTNEAIEIEHTGIVTDKNVEEFDYDTLILDKICKEKKVHVILLIDLLDIPNSIYHSWSKLIQNEKGKKNIDICIIGNKFDLLPNTGPLFEKSVLECLMKHCEEKGIKGDQIKYVQLISAKTGFNIEKMITKFFNLWNDEGNVYLLGMANVGKSVLFNQLLSSDYCRPLASSAILRATTSFWPGTTLDKLKFPITFLTENKKKLRNMRLFKDKELRQKMERERTNWYNKNYQLKDAECTGIVGSSFKPFSVPSGEIEVNVDATYSFSEFQSQIIEGENYEHHEQIQRRRVEEARKLYKPSKYEDKAAWFYDTPGVLGNREILRNFSKQELKIIHPTTIIIPKVYWMTPGQTLFVGGLIRIDLLESTKNERVLFSIMASPALPIINPFNTSEAETLYQKYYDEGNVLRVPHKNHIRENPLPNLEPKTFEISCIGNYKSTADIVFSCFGWAAVTSRPDTKATIRAFTLGGLGLELRTPSLLPYIVNMRQKWSRRDNSQSFKSVLYKKPKFEN